MGTFNLAEADACRHLIDLALDEDLGRQGDVTSSAIIHSATKGTTTIVARQAGVLAGLPAAAMVVARVDRDLQFTSLMSDGDVLKSGDHIASIAGSMTSVLTAERTALNFLQ